MKNRLFHIVYLLAGLLTWSACSDDAEENYGIPVDLTPMTLESTTPAHGGVVEPGTAVATFRFDREVWLLPVSSPVTINGATTGEVAAVGREVRVNVPAVAGGSYTVTLAPGAIRSLGGYVSAESYTLTFTCRQASEPEGDRSPEASKLLQYLQESAGKRILSGTMANVSWNQNEALWVYSKTGKYPAINCVDYLHLYDSAPGSWIDYAQTQFLEEWWQAGGIVSAMWHWNMPNNAGDGYSFTPGTGGSETGFDLTRAVDPTTEEYTRVMADIDRMADYLLLLQQKNIPVIWRPLHEAGGAWFWWGTDREAFIKLWHLMYDRFNERGVNNLIWVWTAAVAWNQELDESITWYPGDAYVDVVSYDIYDKTLADDCLTVYSFLKSHWPDKLVALSECGNVASITDQWNAGACWSWFMPWYDYDRTNDPSSGAFSDDSHGHADAAWWREAVEDERVITRDELPSLK